MLSETTEETVVERIGEATHVIFKRGARGNGLSAGLVETLLEAVRTAATDGTRLLTFRGTGANFCTGFDLADLQSQEESDLVLRFIRIEQLLQELHHAPVETTAFAHGRVFGAGADLFCACDRRVAAPGTTFRFPGIRFGVVLGTRRLAHRVGADAAQDILFAGRELTTEAAERAGMVTKVVPQSDWPQFETDALAAATAIDADASRLARARLRPDTREGDMFALVASVSEPGLKQRMIDYRDSTRPARAAPIAARNPGT